jgi:hypothetical protein
MKLGKHIKEMYLLQNSRRNVGIVCKANQYYLLISDGEIYEVKVNNDDWEFL